MSQKGFPLQVSLTSNGSVYNYKMESIQVDHLKLSGGSFKGFIHDNKMPKRWKHGNPPRWHPFRPRGFFCCLENLGEKLPPWQSVSFPGAPFKVESSVQDFEVWSSRQFKACIVFFLCSMQWCVIICNTYYIYILYIWYIYNIYIIYI